MSEPKQAKEKNKEPKESTWNLSMDRLIYWANFTAIIIVGLSTLMLLFVIGKAISSNSDNQAPKQIDINYTLKVDSTQLKAYRDSSSYQFDKLIQQNNKKVIEEVDNSIKQQYQRMESILSVQEDKNKLFTYGAGFLAILVALATFFGFKSINEMKKSTIEAAEYEAKKIAEEVAKKIAEDKTKEEIQARYEAIENTIIDKVKANLLEEFNNNKVTVSDLDKKIAVLQNRIDVYFASEEMVNTTPNLEPDNSDDTDINVNVKDVKEKDLFTDEEPKTEGDN